MSDLSLSSSVSTWDRKYGLHARQPDVAVRESVDVKEWIQVGAMRCDAMEWNEDMWLGGEQWNAMRRDDRMQDADQGCA